MRVIESVLSEPWAILPSSFNGILQAYFASLDGPKVKFDSKVDKGPDWLRANQSTAIIPISGPLVKGSSFFTEMLGATNYSAIKKAIQSALIDEKVKRIILVIDSPGGQVSGCFELADFINEARQQKPIIAFSDGMIASAAYLIAASTDGIYISGKTNQIGSIGVIARHVDFSKQNDKEGVIVTEIVTGAYKNAFSSDQPLSDLGKQTMQDQVDHIFSVFIADIAARRPNLTAAQIATQEGRVYIGAQAIGAGLVDGIATLADLIDGGLKSKVKTFARTAAHNGAAVLSIPKKEENMNFEELVSQYQQQHGCKRSEAVRQIAMNHKAEHQAWIKDYNDSRSQMQNSKSESPAVGKFNQLVNDYRLQNPRASKGQAMKAVVKSDPEIHKQYLQSLNG
jgi:signal peptide peptidase SppA